VKLLTRIKRLPQRQKIILGLSSFVVLATIGVLIWAAATGQIKPKAASVQISNTATVTYQDAAGNSYSAQSNTVLVDIVPTVNATLALSPATSSTVVGSTFKVDIILNTNGQVSTETDAVLSYNNQELQVVDSNGSAATQITPNTPNVFATVSANTVNSSMGTITYKATGSYAGTGTLASINFKALKAAAPSKVQFAFTNGQTNDSNVLITNGSDILSLASGGDYTITGATSNTINISLALQSGTNFSTTNTVFTIYRVGTTTEVFKSDVTTDSSGKASFTITSPAAGNYDYIIKVNGYLVKAIKNTVYTNPLTLNFGSLKAGDLDSDNHVTLSDFISFRTKFGGSDPVADFDHDGKVTLSDFITFRTNFGLTGD